MDGVKKSDYLQTGFRLIKILEALYKNDLSKNEIKKYLQLECGFELSDETLKLDINTLIKAGFKIKRGTKSNSFKIHLDKNFTMLQLTEDDAYILKTAKDFVLDNLCADEIFKLKSFYQKLAPFIKEDYQALVFDFRFFDMVNEKIFEMLKKAVCDEEICSILYNSPEWGKKEYKILPKNISVVNGKLYLTSYEEYKTEQTTFRFDNILSVKKLENENITNFTRYKKYLQPKTCYKVSKNFYENSPIEGNEKVVFENENFVEIEVDEINDLFIVQKLITLGENCIDISNFKVKNKTLKHLKETLELYN